jgi:hypothetical protein
MSLSFLLSRRLQWVISRPFPFSGLSRNSHANRVPDCQGLAVWSNRGIPLVQLWKWDSIRCLNLGAWIPVCHRVILIAIGYDACLCWTTWSCSGGSRDRALHTVCITQPKRAASATDAWVPLVKLPKADAKCTLDRRAGITVCHSMEFLTSSNNSSLSGTHWCRGLGGSPGGCHSGGRSGELGPILSPRSAEADKCKSRRKGEFASVLIYIILLTALGISHEDTRTYITNEISKVPTSCL